MLQLQLRQIARLLVERLRRERLAGQRGPLEPRELRLSAEATADPAAGSFRLGRLELSSPGLGQAHATASGGRAGPVVAHLHLDLPDLEGVRSALRPVLAPLPSPRGAALRARNDKVGTMVPSQVAARELARWSGPTAPG